MKRIVITCVSFLLFLNAYAQNWYKQDLSAYASIDFPVQPEKGDTLGEDIYTFINDTSFYLVSVRDLSSIPTFALKPEELDKFQDEVIRGAVDACKGKLVSKQPFEINGLRGVDALITSSEIIGMPDLRYKRVIFINKTIYQFDFWVYADQERKTKVYKDKFFNSFKLTGDTTTLKQHTLDQPVVVDAEKQKKADWMKWSIIGAFIIGTLAAALAVWLKIRQGKIK